MEHGLGNEGLDMDKLEDPGEKYELHEIIGTGVNAKVYAATDKNSGHKVAIKVQKVTNENKSSVEDEYKVLRDLSNHPNLPDFYGVYLRSEGNKNYVWFVMELCEGGPVIDLIRAFHKQAKKMNELHIAFILNETMKAVKKLHENHVIHRDIKGSNILLTKNGEVKLVDFGISKELSSTLGRCSTSIGSPSWMAPEVVECKCNKTAYDNRADVWALGITAIELGDGKAPFQDMHPISALFQIVRNPPPTLYRPANWSQTYNDFIAECLEKNPEHRPYLMEIMEHPFITQLPENDFHINAELKSLLEYVTSDEVANRSTEIRIRKGYLKKGPSLDEEPMCVADMAALEKITEDNIIEQLEARFRKNDTYTFIGDVLLFLNPNKTLDIYGYQFYSKYKFKSRSDNEPHIFAIADSAYQNMLHHNTPQHIVISGEIMSGKTQQFKHIVNHLIFLGWNGKQISDKIKKAVEVIQAFGNAATPVHDNSTRHALYTQITFSNSGKISGAIFWLYQLEKWRVTGNRSPYHANFHIFYYLYDGLSSEGNLETYKLEREKSYCYFRRQISEEDVDHKAPLGPRDRPETNAACFRKLKESLTALQFEESEQDLIWKILSAIILLGEIEYKEDEDGNADIKDVDIVDKVASLLEIDGKRLIWALCNYCVIEKDTAARRKHSIPEAIAARNVLAQTLYARVVDWIINLINYKMSLLRAVYGDQHFIGILDMFGFECYDENGLEQLFVNTMNEQLQYYYNQKIFISEIEEEEEEELQLKKFQFYNNRDTMDELFNKPNGLMHILDEANKLNMDSEYIIDALDKKSEGSRILSCGEEEFFVAHYTGKVRYQTTAMCTKNRDFLPPELTEILRCSANNNIKQLFTNKLNRTGNLTINTDNIVTSMGVVKKKSWGSALLADQNRTARPYNTASKGEFSQTRGIRTAAAIFKSTSLEILKSLASGSSYFVRCIRTDLQGTPGGFQQGIIRQQLRALSVIDTAKARQLGYSHRITFAQCLDRYQFLAFDFDEEVEKTRDNCRLLMIRLKLEGWHLGNSKVFLKYYNEEYLSRMYETQVKKIIKVQSMLRSFLAKRNVANKKLKSTPSITESANELSAMSDEQAAIIIQKNIKGYVARKKYGPLINVSTGNLDDETVFFIRRYFNRWKAKSIFQVLILYRAAKYQEFIYFCQQVHLYNQNVVSSLRTIKQEKVQVKNIDTKADQLVYIGEETPTVWKIPFRIKDYPYCESSHLRDTVAIPIGNDEDLPWDEPFKTLDKGCQTNFSIKEEETFPNSKKKNERFNNFISTPYNRDPKTAEKNYKEQTYKYIEDQYEDEKSDYNFNEELDEREYVEQQNNIMKCKSPQPDGTLCKSPRQKGMKSPHRNEPQYLSMIEEEAKAFPFVMNESATTNGSYESKSPYREKLVKQNQLKVNPIAELELKGKQIPRNDPSNDDEPPFNFQAMLRKTNYNRNSLRREVTTNVSPKTSDVINSNGSAFTSSRTIESPVSQHKIYVENSVNDYTTNRPKSLQSSPSRPQSSGNKTPHGSPAIIKSSSSPIKESANVANLQSSQKALKSPAKQVEKNFSGSTGSKSETIYSKQQYNMNQQNNMESNYRNEIPEKTKSRNNSTKKSKNFLRKDSFDSVKLIIGVTKDFENEKIPTSNGIIGDERNTAIKTEILPGLVVVGGPATDL